MRAVIDLLGAMGGIAGAVAVWIGIRALRVSERTQKEAAREHERADARQRLMYLHDVLIALDKLDPNAREPDYASNRQWLRTMLALSGGRNRLPQTAALSDVTYLELHTHAVRLRTEEARQEVLLELEYRADRAYAGEKFG